VKALVEATPISGPTCIEIQPSAMRIACEPIAFTIDHKVAPFFRASSIAASVSAVSPDWEIANTTVPSSKMGSQ